MICRRTLSGRKLHLVLLDQVDLFGELPDRIYYLILVDLDLAEQLDDGPHERCVLANFKELQVKE